MLSAEKEEKPVGCFLKIKQAHHDDFPADYYKAKYACEGCLRRKPLLKHGRKPTVSVLSVCYTDLKQLLGHSLWNSCSTQDHYQSHTVYVAYIEESVNKSI